jgi:choline dehydrogenase-like flavoprotein
MPNYDAIIIGTGQSGPALARRLVAAGRKVAMIERKLFGGTCVNTGCTPTKTLAASAYVAHVARRAADYGVMIGGTVNVDMKAVKARKDAVVAVFRNGVEQSLKTLVETALSVILVGRPLGGSNTDGISPAPRYSSARPPSSKNRPRLIFELRRRLERGRLIND